MPPSPPPLPLTCVVLAGGRSTRMGGDKAAIDLGGETMLQRVLRTACATCARVLVVGRLRPHPEFVPAVDFVPDTGAAFSGPIAGIMTALEAVQGDILLIACDMPLLSSALLGALYAAHCAEGEGVPVATVAMTAGEGGKWRAEPLLAVYTQAILPTFRGWLAVDRRSLQPLLDLPEVRKWRVPPDLHPQLLNVNDRASLVRARDQIGSAGESG